MMGCDFCELQVIGSAGDMKWQRGVFVGCEAVEAVVDLLGLIFGLNCEL
jgi:hypothetical protein